MLARQKGPLQIAIETLDRMEATGLRADRAVRQALRAHPELDAAGRRRAAGGVHGVCCWRARLDHLLASSAPGNRLRVAAWCVDVLGEEPGAVADTLDLDERERLLVERVFEQAEGWPDEPVAYLAVHGSLPRWVAERLVQERGLEEAEALVTALSRPGPVSLRANLLRGTREEVQERLLAEGIWTRPGRLAPAALVAETGSNLWGSFAWRSGDFEIQDEGSQLIAEAVGARPGDIVLDLCAGRGGKTLALAAAMHDEGRLVASDTDPSALRDLEARLARVRLGCVEVLPLPAGPDVPLLLRADRVLVDAPCSALGTLRRGQDHRWRLTEAEADAFPDLQLALLERGAAQLVPGGRLVYATCTVLRAENQGVVERFLGRQRSRFVPEPVLQGPLLEGGLIDGAAASQLELLPHRHDTDGFFVAAFRKLR